jgi:hypothetical protein
MTTAQSAITSTFTTADMLDMLLPPPDAYVGESSSS